MRVVFFGTPELAVPCAEAVAARHEVTAVVCQPDRPKGRGKQLAAPPVKAWALARGIAVHQPERLNDGAFETWLRGQQPDACPIAAYGRILKQPILDVPRHGFINMHPSLLPKYRGPSPMQSAVLDGETETGVSIMRLTLDMDAGDIILQERAAIDPEEDAAELTERLARRGADMLADALDRIERGEAVFTPQDHGAATYCRMLTKEDGAIRWAEPARTLHNRVRGAVPWPAAQCRWQGEVCKILRSVLDETPVADAPGTVVRVDGGVVYVATGAGALGIAVFQAPGKKAMAMADYLRGRAIQPGERFEDA